ncbi:hypothetical protein ABK040_012121 [Willaertia magna]
MQQHHHHVEQALSSPSNNNKTTGLVFDYVVEKARKFGELFNMNNANINGTTNNKELYIIPPDDMNEFIRYKIVKQKPIEEENDRNTGIHRVEIPIEKHFDMNTSIQDDTISVHSVSSRSTEVSYQDSYQEEIHHEFMLNEYVNNVLLKKEEEIINVQGLIPTATTSSLGTLEEDSNVDSNTSTIDSKDTYLTSLSFPVQYNHSSTSSIEEDVNNSSVKYKENVNIKEIYLQLERLKQTYAWGIINEEEYEKKRMEISSQLNPVMDESVDEFAKGYLSHIFKEDDQKKEEKQQGTFCSSSSENKVFNNGSEDERKEEEKEVSLQQIMKGLDKDRIYCMVTSVVNLVDDPDFDLLLKKHSVNLFNNNKDIASTNKKIDKQEEMDRSKHQQERSTLLLAESSKEEDDVTVNVQTKMNKNVNDDSKSLRKEEESTVRAVMEKSNLQLEKKNMKKNSTDNNNKEEKVTIKVTSWSDWFKNLYTKVKSLFISNKFMYIFLIGLALVIKVTYGYSSKYIQQLLVSGNIRLY